jgi:hypothetical protein
MFNNPITQADFLEITLGPKVAAISLKIGEWKFTGVDNIFSANATRLNFKLQPFDRALIRRSISRFLVPPKAGRTAIYEIDSASQWLKYLPLLKNEFPDLELYSAVTKRRHFLIVLQDDITAQDAVLFNHIYHASNNRPTGERASPS